MKCVSPNTYITFQRNYEWLHISLVSPGKPGDSRENVVQTIAVVSDRFQTLLDVEQLNAFKGCGTD
jgi:hypothetical protein